MNLQFRKTHRQVANKVTTGNLPPQLEVSNRKHEKRGPDYAEVTIRAPDGQVVGYTRVALLAK
jgi:hypothetical protein